MRTCTWIETNRERDRIRSSHDTTRTLIVCAYQYESDIILKRRPYGMSFTEREGQHTPSQGTMRRWFPAPESARCRPVCPLKNGTLEGLSASDAPGSGVSTLCRETRQGIPLVTTEKRQGQDEVRGRSQLFRSHHWRHSPTRIVSWRPGRPYTAPYLHYVCLRTHV